jgi:hypothetical protein
VYTDPLLDATDKRKVGTRSQCLRRAARSVAPCGRGDALWKPLRVSQPLATVGPWTRACPAPARSPAGWVAGQLSRLKTLVSSVRMSSWRVELQSPAEELEHPLGLGGHLRIDFCADLCQCGLETLHLVAELLDDVACQFWCDGLAERW